MNLILAISGIIAFLSSAQATPPPRIYELPKFTKPPVLDGNRSTVPGEWGGALQQECSPSQVLRDGAEYGWQNEQDGWGWVSANVLSQGPGEDSTVVGTDADVSAQIWQAWDDEALYYIAEVRDNVRDVVNSGPTTGWWERDSMSLYIDLNNEDASYKDGYVGLNIVNFVAAPQTSSPVTRTLEITVQNARQATQDPDALEGFTYGFRDAGQEFGGQADYVIEGRMEWAAFLRANLNSKPTVGSKMGYGWILVDADGNEGYGGQLLCVSLVDEPEGAALYDDYLFADMKAGPGTGTPVEADSWGRIKATFGGGF